MSAALDAELGAGDSGRLAVHLERCAACRAERSRLERVHALLAGAARHEPRPGLWLRVLAAARAGGPRPSRIAAPARALAGAAAFAAVIAVGVVSGSFLAGPPSPGSVSPLLSSFEIFAAAPPASPGGAYLAMLGGGE